MNKYAKVAIVLLVALLIFSTIPQHLLKGVEASTGPFMGARAVKQGEELFIGGNYMELGISKWGDFGTEGSKPATFNGTTKRSNIGMSVVHDGFDSPGAKAMDYYLPGSPEERFAVGFQVGATKTTKSNSAVQGSKDIPTVVTDESILEDGKLQARIVSTWADTMEITQVVSFSENDRVFKNEVTIKNISSTTWDNARYMRSLDPDNTVDIGGSYTTNNVITHTIAEDGIALVKAEATSGEPNPLFFYSSDAKAKGSIFGFSNKNPYASQAYDNPPAKGTVIKADMGMTMTWETHNALAPNASETFIYYTSLDSRDPAEIVADLGGATTGFNESVHNDGSVEGVHKVSISGFRLHDEIDPSFLYINNLPAGFTLGTVKRLTDNILEISIAGKATNHESHHSIENASLTIGRENILVGVKDITSESFSITFKDKAKAHIKSSTVAEDVYDSGDVTGEIIVDISGGLLQETVGKEQITINNLPEGVTYEVYRVTDTQLRIVVSGSTTNKTDVLDASVTLNKAALIGSDDRDLTTNTFYINFLDKEPYLFVENPILKESDENDGTFKSLIKLKLLNATFKDQSVINDTYKITLTESTSTVIDGVYTYADGVYTVIGDVYTVVGDTYTVVDSVYTVIDGAYTVIDNVYTVVDGVYTVVGDVYTVVNGDYTAIDGLKAGTDAVYGVADVVYGISLPEGLVIEGYTLNSPTEMTVTLGGKAALATSLHNIVDAQIAILTGIVTLNASDYEFDFEKINSNTLSFFFIDDNPKVSINLDELVIDWDYTITDTLVLTVEHGVFKEEISVEDLTVNNLPEGVVIESITRTSANELVITFEVLEDEEVILDGTSKFVSISIADGGIVGTSSPLTTSSFEMRMSIQADVTWNRIKGKNKAQTNVASNLNLVTEVLGGPVTWTSTKRTIVATDGKVTPALTSFEEVTLTATFMLDGERITRTFNLVVYPAALKLASITVLDTTPTKVTLQFNQPVDGITLEDFESFTIDGQTIKSIESVDGTTVVVTLDVPLSPESALVVVYDSAIGNVVSSIGANSELEDMTARNQGRLEVINEIVPLKIVSLDIRDGHLEIIFNKDVNPDTFSLDGLMFDGVQITGRTTIEDNKVRVNLKAGSYSELTYTPGTITEKNNSSNYLLVIKEKIADEDSEDGDREEEITEEDKIFTLNKDKSYLNPLGKVTGGISFKDNQNLNVPLTPTFNAETGKYNAEIKSTVHYVTVTSTLTAPKGTYAKLFFNGEEIDLDTNRLVLNQGSNLLVYKVYDETQPHILLTQYVFELYRIPVIYDENSGNQGGSGSVTQEDINEPTPSPGISNGQLLDIERTNDNGITKDKMTIKEEDAKNMIDSTKDKGNQTVVIQVPDELDSDDFTLNIVPAAATNLNSNDRDVELRNQGAIATIDSSTFTLPVSDDLYLRFIPVKDEVKKKDVEKNIQELAEMKKINVVGKPFKVETNLSNKNVKLYLPLDGVKIPTVESEKQQLFKRLGVYASYDNGGDDLITGTIVQRDGKYGIEFTMNEAGTFSLAAVSASADRYVVGFPDGDFRPNASAQRGQIALMFARNMGFVTTDAYTSKYSDLPQSHYSNQAVAFMSDLNLMDGYEDGTFQAGKSMTRAEMISIAVKYMGIDVSKYTDASSSNGENHWAQNIIVAARELGLIAEDEIDFRPDDEITRLEAVQIINLVFERQPLNREDDPSFNDVLPGTPGFGQIEESVNEFDTTIFTVVQ